MNLKSGYKFEIIILISLLLASTLPFIYKPFHVDDSIFIDHAKHLISKPLDPYSSDYYLVGQRNSGLNFIDPPLVAEYYSIIIRIFGDSEVILHLFYMPFSVLSALSIYFITKRFVKNYFLCSLLIITTPSFFIMYHNLMLDIPVIAFFLASIALFIYGLDKNNKIFIILSISIASITPLIKYNGLLIIPAIGAYALIKKKYKYLTLLTIPLIVAGLWEGYTFMLYGTGHMTYSALGINNNSMSATAINWAFIAVRFFTLMIYIGGISVWSVFFAPKLLKDKSAKVIMSISFIVSIIATFFIRKKSADFVSGIYSFNELVIIALFFCVGIFYIGYYLMYYLNGILKTSREIIENLSDLSFLMIWLMLTVVGNILFAGGAVRYYTMTLVPFSLVLFIVLEGNENKDKMISIKQIGVVCLIFTFILSISMAYADYRHSSVYKDFPTKISQFNYYNLNGNTVIYFFGDYGFVYYMNKDGRRYVVIKDIQKDIEKDRKEGKSILVIKPGILFPRDVNKLYFNDSLKLLYKSEYSLKFPLRIQNYKSHAGYYTFSSGLLPYAFSKEPLEVFYVYLYSP